MGMSPTPERAQPEICWPPHAKREDAFTNWLQVLMNAAEDGDAVMVQTAAAKVLDLYRASVQNSTSTQGIP